MATLFAVHKPPSGAGPRKAESKASACPAFKVGFTPQAISPRWSVTAEAPDPL
jgi:hypothetical protein